MKITQLIKEPLTHFIVIAVGLFLAFDVMNDNEDDAQHVINVSSGRVEQLHQRFVKVWQRTPTQEEMDKLINNYVMDEIYAREARGLGLDVNDGVIRKRLRQKMEFMMQDITSAQPPDAQELARFFKENQNKYREPNAYSFQQVFISDDSPEKIINVWVGQQQKRINKGLEPEGASSLLPKSLQSQSLSIVARLFGNEFAKALSVQPIEQWSGPIRSGYGLHFIYISDIQHGSLPKLSQIEDNVLADWRYQKNLANQKSYEQDLLDRYEVNVNMPTLVAGDY
ncbi:peptidyl-prolyl cis-trans isomerase [Thalassotalea litorea]|uniref:peptidylprolyl isomerase n=1 Tax=Thalassotalea litorea TaxID=2020715 RepID=A0A5R9IT69_9GAMM|nr:peptidylprolyl isomerase [Thalassotalea litorea]TLU65118.1 peptidyl-prolyl cis-trans isomerase [Thalassotalea litorea]